MPILEEAARRFGAQIAFEHHAFELRPVPVPLLDPKGEYIREHWTNRVYPMAAERGLLMRLPPMPTRTRRAHETAAFARAHGKFEQVDRALYRAFFEHGLDINDVAVLERIVRDADLDPDALGADEFSNRVRTDIALAAQFGIQSVPTMLVGDNIDDAEPVIGAVPYQWLEGAIHRALSGDRTHARLRRRMIPQLRILE